MVEPPDSPATTPGTPVRVREGELPRPRLRPIPAWVIVVGLPVMVLVAVAAVWLLLGAGLDGTKLDAIRTGTTLGVGLGGVLVLWLAIRRQRSTELDLLAKYEAHELAERTATATLAHQQQVANDAREDAKARRITDLYTKAVEQLGSDKAPVRLGGLYALERLAQDNDDDPRLRQTVVNVWCAYLRMPYTMPEDVDEKTVTLDQEKRQEREVRLAAQRVLVAHLHPGRHPDHPVDTYWPDIHIDLTGATLADIDLSDCRLATASFVDAIFTGIADFARVEVDESAWFLNARFGVAALFDGAQFGGYAGFNGARFGGHTRFEYAHFEWTTWFDEAEFADYVTFDGADFRGEVLMTSAYARVGDAIGTWPPGWKVGEPAAREGSDGLWAELVQDDDAS